MTLRLDAPPSPPAASMPGRKAVSGRRTLLRRLVALAAVAGPPAWAVHRAVPPGGELVNQGGSALLDDLAATALHPSLEAGFLGVVLEATATTLALALLGTAGALVMGLAGGLILSDVAWGGSLPWPVRVGRLLLRGTLVAVRSVHELVWALLFVSVLGLDPLVAVLALALPFGAQSAQVFGETFDTVPDAPLRSLRAAGARRCSELAYALLPGTAPLLLSYSFYRFECALRSAVVLGVAGVGGLGFELTVSLQSRNWGEVWTLVAALVALAGVVELWSNRVRSDLAVVTCADWSAGHERSREQGRSSRGLSRGTRWSLALVVPAIAVAWWWAGLSPAGLASARTRDLAGQLLLDLSPPALPEGGLRVLAGAALDTVAMAVLATVVAVVITLVVGSWAARPPARRPARLGGPGPMERLVDGPAPPPGSAVDPPDGMGRRRTPGSLPGRPARSPGAGALHRWHPRPAGRRGLGDHGPQAPGVPAQRRSATWSLGRRVHGTAVREPPGHLHALPVRGLRARHRHSRRRRRSGSRPAAQRASRGLRLPRGHQRPAGIVTGQHRRRDTRTPVAARASGLTPGRPRPADGLTWVPAIDGTVIKEPTRAALEAGRYTKVPLISGTNKDEGRLFVALQTHLLKFRRANADELEAALRSRGGPVTDELRNAYPPESPDSADLALAAVLTDGVFSCPALFTDRAAASNAGQAVYAYEFADPDPPLSDLDPLMPPGDFHASELFYLFTLADLNAAQERLSNQMVAYWTTFAKTGDPNGPGTPRWPVFTPGSTQMQRLTSQGTAPFPTFATDHKCHLWD